MADGGRGQVIGDKYIQGERGFGGADGGWGQGFGYVESHKLQFHAQRISFLSSSRILDRRPP